MLSLRFIWFCYIHIGIFVGATDFSHWANPPCMVHERILDYLWRYPLTVKASFINQNRTTSSAPPPLYTKVKNLIMCLCQYKWCICVLSEYMLSATFSGTLRLWVNLIEYSIYPGEKWDRTRYCQHLLHIRVMDTWLELQRICETRGWGGMMKAWQ